MRPFHLIALLVLSLAACAPRPTVVLTPGASAIPGNRIEKVFFATTRNEETRGRFGDKRIYDPRFGRVDVSIPRDHTPGKLEVKAGTPNPAKDFAIASEARFAGANEFRARLAAALKKRPKGQREVVLFVHGFNVNFAEGAFRLAQLVDDFGITGVPVYFSWSSAANVLGYEHDRDSALFARDALQKVIVDARQAGAESILLVSHSMGAFLSMETLRQMAIQDPGWPRRAVNAVVLISPDIDVSVFKSQAWRMGKLPQPFIMFVSNKDRALQLSAWLSGEKNQLGNIRNVDQVKDFPVTVFNVTKFSKRGDLNHFVIGNSPALIQLFKNAGSVNTYMQDDPSGRTGLFPGTVLAVQKATEILLEPLSYQTTP